MGVSPAARRRPIAGTPVAHLALLPGWIAAGGLLVVALADVSLPPAYGYAVLIVGAVLFGLPHGAVDYLVPARAAGSRPIRSLVAVGGLYLVFGGAYAALWFLAPAVAAVGFLGLTWYHWGQGDLHALVALAGADHLRTRRRRIATVAVRGGLPMVVPLLAFPDRYRAVVASFVAPFAGSRSLLAVLFATEVRLALGGGLAALTVAALAVGRDGTDPRGWRLEAAETGLLWVYFAVAPPVLAVGVYFSLWHSVRHAARYALLDGNAGGDRECPPVVGEFTCGPALARFARDAAPATVAALALLGVLAALVPVPPASTDGWIALYLVLVAVLTLPHAVVVTWLDRRQTLWTPPQRGLRTRNGNR